MQKGTGQEKEYRRAETRRLSGLEGEYVQATGSTLKGEVVQKFVVTARCYMARQNQEGIFKGNMINIMRRDWTLQPALVL